MYLVLPYLLICKMGVQQRNTMKKLNRLILNARVWTDIKGQDLIEYSLMAGFVAVAAGAIMPGVANNISKIFSNVASAMKKSSSQGS
jgi:pilus assembly protein Flp/PilA